MRSAKPALRIFDPDNPPLAPSEHIHDEEIRREVKYVNIYFTSRKQTPRAAFGRVPLDAAFRLTFLHVIAY